MRRLLAVFGLLVFSAIPGWSIINNNVASVLGSVIAAENDCHVCSVTEYHGCYATIQPPGDDPVNVYLPGPVPVDIYLPGDPVPSCADLVTDSACVEVTGKLVTMFISSPTDIGTLQLDGHVWGFVEPGDCTGVYEATAKPRK
jgi:hypothetical protein